MAKNARILENALLNNDKKTVGEILLPINESFMGRYGIVFRSEEDKLLFFGTAFRELYEDYRKEKENSSSSKLVLAQFMFESYYKKNLLAKLKAFIRCYTDEDICNFTKKFINTKMGYFNAKDLESCVMWLEKIDVFYLMLGLMPSVSLIEEILHDDKISVAVSSLIKSYTHDNVINSGRLYSISQGKITSMLLEIYCRENKIEIDKTTDASLNDGSLDTFFEHSSFDSVKMYLKEIGSCTLLSPLEELLAFKEYHQGNKNIKNKIIESNLRLVVNVAKNYLYTGVELLDLIQYGNFGLYEAVEKYDVNSGYKFSTYATWWIQQNITRSVATECASVRIPVWLVDGLHKYHAVFNRLKTEFGRDPEIFEVAECLGWTIEKTMNVVASEPNVISIDQKVNDDDDSDSFDHFIASDVTVEEDIVNNVLHEQLNEKIFDVLEKINISDRERDVILYRFGFKTGKEETLETVAKQYNVTRERIRQIEAKVLKKLRSGLARKELAYYLDDPEGALQNLRVNKDAIRRGVKAIGSTPRTSKVKKKTYNGATVARTRKPKHTVNDSENITVVINRNPTLESTASNRDESLIKERFLSSYYTSKKEVLSKSQESSDDSSSGNLPLNRGLAFDRENHPKVATNDSLEMVVDNENAMKEIVLSEKEGPLEVKSSDTVLQTDGVIMKEQEECSALVDVKDVECSVLVDNIDKAVNSIESQEVTANQPVKPKQRSDASVTLREKFSLVDLEVLDRIVAELTDKQQEIVKKRGVVRLDKYELNDYNSNIIPKVKRRIAREVALGNLSEEILAVYNIESYEANSRKARKSSSKDGSNNYLQTLSETFDKIDKSVLDSIVATFSEEQQAIVKKRETSRLNDNERGIYFSTIVPKVKRRIAREVALGRLESEILEIYNIKPDTITLKELEKSKSPVCEKTKKQGKTLRETFSKVDLEVFNRLVSSLTDEQQEIVSKRETGKLSRKEQTTYFSVIIPKIKRGIVREVYLGNLNKDLLDEYEISTTEQILDQIEGKKVKRKIQGLTLKQSFSKIDESLLDAMILELSEEAQTVVKKREAGIKLTDKERSMYYGYVFYNIRNKIAREVYNGNISEEVLDEYNIRPYNSKVSKIAPENKKYNLTVYERYSKIDSCILDGIISSFPQKYIDIIKKRETARLTSKEKSTYNSTILPKIRAGIAKEASRGNVPLDVLSEYAIEPIVVTNTANTTSVNDNNIVVKINADSVGSQSCTRVFKVNGEISVEQKQQLLSAGEKASSEKCITSRKRCQQEVDTEKQDSSLLSLRKRFTDVDRTILEQIISEFPKKQKKIINRRENYQLDSEDNKEFVDVIIPKVERRIAEEVFLGNLPSEILENHQIEPVTKVRKRKKAKKEKLASAKDVESSGYDVLKARLLTIVDNQKTEELDEMEKIFNQIFDSSYLTEELNPKMFSYISMRFGYLDGNNYSKEAIARVLSEEDIGQCHQNVLLYVKYEINKLLDSISPKDYQKIIGKMDSKK